MISTFKSKTKQKEYKGFMPLEKKLKIDKRSQFLNYTNIKKQKNKLTKNLSLVN